MPLAAIGLLFLSALLHTTWNLLLKKSDDKFVASWWTVVVGGVLSLAVMFFVGLPARTLWAYLFFSVLVEAAYFVTLSLAYRDHDFSLIYPLARGAAPAFLALWSLIFIGERPTLGGFIGLGLIIAGLLIIGTSTLLQSETKSIHLKGIALGLTTALFISTYTAIDGTAVKQGHAVAYAFAIFTLIPVAVAPYVLTRYPFQKLIGVWNQGRSRFVLIGILGVAAYFVALMAYRFAPLSYSGAIREVSVVIGAFAGWKFLGERLGGTRLIGAAVIFAGILVIALFG
ncbi:MAG TPA: DMT family transporter [Anaerolineales bacterium]|jgi:drug/metabolite transporter (DMT)-like permease|nr:DMT family transporter [Anaerolineales bacterium]